MFFTTKVIFFVFFVKMFFFFFLKIKKRKFKINIQLKLMKDIVIHCIIWVSVSFNSQERRSIQNALKISGMKVERLINESKVTLK